MLLTGWLWSGAMAVSAEYQPVLREARALRDRLSEQQRAAAKKQREQAKREAKQREGVRVVRFLTLGLAERK